MSAERDPVEALLASIADGAVPDWDAAERADPAQRARVASLRDVSRIADFNRTHQRAEEPSASPERWGDLLLLERVGSGTHAEVYRAWDPGLQREVALKLMRPGPDDTVLLDEARAAARVRHPHVVTVHGVDRRGERVGLWMELIRGPSLEQEVRVRGPVDATEARRLGVAIGSALAAVHAAGILHRDIKPANVIRDAEGRWVLTDFGLGLVRSRATSEPARPSGTPMYMAPETYAGGPASERSDLYALGLTLWFAVAGRHPFAVDTLAELSAVLRTGPRPRLREVRPDVPARLAALVERAIAPSPEARFPEVRSMVQVLEALPDAARPGPARVRALAGAALLVVVGAVALGFWWTQRPEAPARVAPTLVQPSPSEMYTVEASFLRRERSRSVRLVAGDRVRPGDRLSLEVRTSRPAWVYVLNEDEAGEQYLLFPHPRLDARNPLAPDSTFILPGSIGAGEHAWTVTSAGGREHFLVVVSPAPVSEIEADLDRFPAPRPGRAIAYPTVGEASLERLRGVGGMDPLPPETARPERSSRAFERFRSLAGRETGIEGVWVRQIVLENPSP